MIRVLIAVALIGVAHADSSVAPFASAALKIDTLQLGMPIAAFEERWAKTLCDRDPIEGRTRTIWFHAPKPCREAEPLPGKTIVVLYTKSKAVTDPLDAVAWFGDWPRSAGSFPLTVGVDRAAAAKALGAAKKMFDFAGQVDGGERIIVWRHAGGVYSLERDGKTFGYLAGAMGDDPKREEWRGLIANVLRYLR
jgi:hypothetical protein